ncbi:MAG TPA: fibronectin type III domain-containing protein [Desulfobacteraceae bacterium]|nr:fibronectin type III domain-containing protein [Desulfobacteraceae bacterium]
MKFRNILLKSVFYQAVFPIFSLIICLHLSCYAAEITVQWDPNTEPDLEGYVVYYKTGSSGEPYDYFDTVPVAELNDPHAPEYTIIDLDYDEDYFIAVTAYDSEGLESDYSNEVIANIPLPPEEKGGSGGGCFIDASRQ